MICTGIAIGALIIIVLLNFDSVAQGCATGIGFIIASILVAVLVLFLMIKGCI